MGQILKYVYIKTCERKCFSALSSDIQYFCASATARLGALMTR